MKTFKKIISEVAQPKSGEEKKFKDQHEVDVVPHPQAGDEVFKGTKAAKPKAKRKADQEGDANYDKAYMESVEELDEISKKTLGSYINKAHKDYDKQRTKQGAAYDKAERTGRDEDEDKGHEYGRKADKRTQGIKTAVSKLTKEEVEQIDEVSKKTLSSYIKKAVKDKNAEYNKAERAKSDDKAMDHLSKARKRVKGVDMAHKKMKEDVEQIDEISKKTLGSYIKKAGQSSQQLGDKSIDLMNKGMNNPDKKTASAYMTVSDKKYAKSQRRGKYLNKAVDRLTKEEVEQLDEIGDTSAGKKKLKNLIVNRTQKVADAGASLERRPEKAAEYDRAQKRHMKTIGRAATRLAKEEVEQLDELSPDLKSRYAKKAATSLKRATTYKAKAQDDAAKASKNIDRGYGGDRSVNINKQYNRLDRADAKVAKHDKTIAKRTTGLKRANEEVEQLDELSPNTLHSYIKKAAGNMAGNAAVAAAQASSSMKKSSPDVKRNIRNRMRGITGASGRLADKANMAENWQEEIPMMMRQLEFISYAAEEIMDYLDMAGDPEEWFQNKLAGIHQSMLSMYAYAQGGRRAGYGFDEEVDLEEELKGGQKKLDHNKNGKIDAHDFHLMRKKKMKEEADLEEAAFAMDIDYNAEKRLAAAAKAAGLAIKFVQAGGATEMQLRGDKDKITKFLKARRVPASEISRGWFGEETELDEVTRSAVKRPVNITGPDGKTRTVYKSAKSVSRDEHGQEKIKTNESVEILDEAFKQGIVKLKDGGSVVLKKEDADLLNQMFKDLSSANRKKMQEVAMKDKAGFEEILGFAREAL